MKTALTLSEVKNQISEETSARRDLLVPASDVRFEDDLSVNVRYGGPQEGESFRPTGTFLDQVASATGMGVGFLHRMQESGNADDLIAYIFNRLLTDSKSERMVRTMGGRARAYLSNSYRRIDNDMVMTNVVDSILASDDSLEVVSSNVDDDYMHVKIISPKLQGEVVPGDFVRMGAVIRNSEVGLSNLAIEMFVERLVCTNGMVMPVSIGQQRRRHIGRRLGRSGGTEHLLGSELPASFEFDTLGEDFWDFYANRGKQVISMESLEKVLTLYQRAAQMQFHPASAEHIGTVVERLRKQFGLSTEESDGVLEHWVHSRDLSLYGLANAVTRQSQDVPGYNQATRLEQIGGEVVALSPAIWKQLSDPPTE